MSRPLSRAARREGSTASLREPSFGDLRDHLHWHFEVQNATMAMRLVNAGVALTILPRSAIGMAPASLVALPFHGVRLQRTLGIVSRRAVPISGQASELLGLITAEMLERFSAHVDVSSDRASRPRD
ncbi:MAG: LysR substrate-binding domain-containing protein [Paracoccus sp. (in: a-proteobacteria)]